MAKKTVCDIPDCDKPAVSEAEFKTTTTTPIKADLCGPHLADIKQIMRVFFQQEGGELSVSEQEVEVVKPNKS